MEEAASNACDVEEAPSSNERSDEKTRTNLAALQLPKVFTTRNGAVSNCAEQTMLLEQMEP